MRAATEALLGRRDFASFQSSGSPRRSTVRTVAGLALEEDGDALRLDVVADGFLYGMVRAIAGTLTEVGRGRLAASGLPQVLSARDRATRRSRRARARADARPRRVRRGTRRRRSLPPPSGPP